MTQDEQDRFFLSMGIVTGVLSDRVKRAQVKAIASGNELMTMRLNQQRAYLDELLNLTGTPQDRVKYMAKNHGIYIVSSEGGPGLVSLAAVVSEADGIHPTILEKRTLAPDRWNEFLIMAGPFA